jgi:PAS domain S-box-containing protein
MPAHPYENSGVREIVNRTDAYVVLIDEDFNIFQVNKKMREKFGEVEGMKCYQVLHSLPHPPDHCPVLKMAKDREVNIAYEHSLGKLVKIETKRVVIDNSEYLLHIMEDLTPDVEREAFEKVMGEIKEKYKNIIDNVPVGIFIFQDGRFVFVNEELTRMTGYSKVQLHRLDPFILLHRDYVEETKKYSEFALAGNTEKLPDYFIVKLIRRDGSEIWVEFKYNLINYRGKPALLVSAVDVSEIKKLKERIKESEESFRALAENAITGVLVYQDDYYVYVNPVVEKLTGYTREELMSAPFWEFAHSSIKEVVKDRGRRRQRGEKVEPTIYEIPYLTKSGEVRWGLFAFSNTIYNGKPAGVTIFFDITEKKMLEERLKESEQKFRMLFENANDAIFIHEFDGRIIEVNQTACKRLGYTKEELLNMTPMDIDTPEYAALVPKRIEELREKRHLIFETAHVSKDGRVIPTEISGTVIEFGGRQVILSIARDISDRKQAEQFFEGLFTNSPIGVYIVQDGKFKMVNPQFLKITGYSREELLGRDSLTLVVPEDRGLVREKAIKMLKGECFTPYEYRAISKNGEIKWVMETVTSIQYQGRRAALGSFMDVTERKEAEKAIIQLNEVLRLINKIIRHDILNNLSAISGALETFVETRDERLLETARKAVDKGIELIKRMRELELLVSSAGDLRPFSAREVVKEVVKDYPIEFNVEGDCQVLADDALISVIDNIVKNAIIHSESEKIDIKIEKKGEFCEIKIVDYGKGIPDEIKDRIFEEGFKYGKTGRSGLGLYIVKKMVERYGGDVRVEDNQPRGSIFIIRLKVVKNG